ncbi:MAG: hypothetical protein ACR2NU_12870 [Aeoliella sp.]
MKPDRNASDSPSATHRRTFLKSSLLTSAAATSGLHGVQPSAATAAPVEPSTGERLYNGIQLPTTWPPRNMEPDSYSPMPLPYLQSPPKVIPIDVGRQLFVDDFLIEYTDLERSFHQPVKHDANPLLKPETEVEMNQGLCPTAAPFSDGCFYDPDDQLFKMWYMAGWYRGTALATSRDGISWERPQLDVVPGTNLVLPTKDTRDGVSLWLDHDASEPEERFKMYRFERSGTIRKELTRKGGYILTSADGIHWNWRGQIGKTGDNSTFFYNPFRKRWVFTVRTVGRAAPPWAAHASDSGKPSRGRARSYWENEAFLAAVGGWQGYDPVFWLGADRFDRKRKNYALGREPQLYKIDAVGYESLMLGLLQPHYGPPNEECARGGFPKLTELQLAFSRDGFHWDRSCRQTFIGATLEKESWERAYVHSIGGVCNIVGDQVYFYYTAFQGDETNRRRQWHLNGMNANASTGLAVLRRDGFASIDAGDEEGILLTRPLKFSGKYLFVNAAADQLRVEVCQEDGRPIPGFSRDECRAFTGDSTKQRLTWRQREDLESISGQQVRLKFYLRRSRLYSFWVSRNQQGASGGATAAGGPGLSGTWDA